MPELDLDEESVAYRVRHSARARRLRITVGPEGVEVVVPVGAPARLVQSFVAQHRGWIAARTAALQRTLDAHPGAERLVDGAFIPYRGGTLALRVRASERRALRVHLDEALHVLAPQPLQVLVPETVPAADREPLIERGLVRFLRRQVAGEAAALVARHGPPNDLVPRAIRIKEQKRLWGSCTASGVINLNWRLILAPPAVLEYLVVHELCHLRERHHQPTFWQLVARLQPDFQRHRRWLKAHGHLLTLRRTTL
jgi:predicted metal-dependent hydrolase